MSANTFKVALITGAARRIGAEIARVLHANNINIVLHYKSSEKEAKDLCANLNKIRPSSAITVSADLSKLEELSGIIDVSIQTFGQLDILINNASQFYATSVLEVSSESWNELMDVNVKIPFFLVQKAIPFLKKTSGCIINIADIHGEKPLKHYSIYCISKAALIMLTKSLAKELGPEIRVNAISPGSIIWPEGENALTPEKKQKILSRTVLKKEGDPIEIAKAALFFAVDGKFITGQVLAVDGGRSLFI